MIVDNYNASYNYRSGDQTACLPDPPRLVVGQAESLRFSHKTSQETYTMSP
jgi:hypothetical protein